MTQRKLVETSDGSHSLFSEQFNEQYHSRHGALQESRHVFIQMGWEQAISAKKKLTVLEIGFGTGLNALLTVFAAQKEMISVEYFAVEAYPVSTNEAEQLNYPEVLGESGADVVFQKLHEGPWNQAFEVTPNFRIKKVQATIEDFELETTVDLIYFDAFSPEKQPELWTLAIFEKMYRLMNLGGILTTYCAKGVVRRTLKAAGFEVMQVAGPPGKREMLVAYKKSSELPASNEI